MDDEPPMDGSFPGMEDDDRFSIITATSGEEPAYPAGLPHQIVLTDLLMPRMDGLHLLEEIKRCWPDTFVLMLTGVDSADKAVKAMKAGAYDYILKPLDIAMVRLQLGKILQHRQLLQDTLPPAGDDYRFENMVGKDPIMFKLFEKIQQVAQSEATVLICGESGTGKELIAEAIHARSRRCDKPFVRVNCAALTESLISSALFGHEKGAFTGAATQKTGFFEYASKGTIFLDEIGDIPVQTQVALLRVLEMGSFQRVGGTETINVDVRVICATNQDMSTAVKEKTFREDLYYRINVVSLAAPALRERKSDIPLLAQFFLELYQRKSAKTISGFSRPAWPGYVTITGPQCASTGKRIERAVIFCQGRQILPSICRTNCTTSRT